MHAAWHTVWFWLLIVAFILWIVAIILDVCVYRNFTAPWWIWLMIGIALLLALVALVWYLCDNHSKVRVTEVIYVEKIPSGEFQAVGQGSQLRQVSQTTQINRPDTPVSNYPSGYRALLGVEENGVVF